MTKNRWNLPDLGLGVGLRTPHYSHILAERPEIGFFEVLTENYLDTGGRPLYLLDKIAEHYPMVMHGVSMSIGSVDPLDWDYLRRLKSLADRVDPLDAEQDVDDDHGEQPDETESEVVPSDDLVVGGREHLDQGIEPARRATRGGGVDVDRAALGGSDVGT